MITPYSNIISVTTLAPNLLLDTYPNAAAAYSLRKLRGDYTGSAIRVRIATTGNPEYNIGFVDGELDVATLEGYCTGGLNAFVKTWYDQSGNATDATQETAENQPQIVSSGSVILENGKISVQFDGSNDYLILNSTLSLLKIHSNFTVANNNNKSTAVLYGSTSPTSNFNSDNLQFAYNAGGIFATVNGFQYGQRLFSVIRNNTTTVNIYQNTSSFSLTIGANNDFTVKEIARRADLGSYLWLGTIQEIIFYPSDESSNRTGIEDNINDFYSIY